MSERRTVEVGVPRNKRTRVLGVPEVARPYKLTFNIPYRHLSTMTNYIRKKILPFGRIFSLPYRDLIYLICQIVRVECERNAFVAIRACNGDSIAVEGDRKRAVLQGVARVAEGG